MGREFPDTYGPAIRQRVVVPVAEKAVPFSIVKDHVFCIIGVDEAVTPEVQRFQRFGLACAGRACGDDHGPARAGDVLLPAHIRFGQPDHRRVIEVGDEQFRSLLQVSAGRVEIG
ncbi:hypothetical protein [Arthrobacter sp. B2a2-09]|uniref:hypothetical protein n=1 Tax=Arthrobacter sp. B2a2-09 TaxID=2952822 RepID=UPI0022CD3B48|nr:hypothetical protein [Arthrobacter sp. B2a2-09]